MFPQSLKTQISGVLCALTFLLVCSFTSQPRLLAANHIIYVNDDASGSNNGSSWANAYTKLQDALVAATAGDEIWVAAGVYYPDEGGNAIADNMYMSFELVSGVALYGGFAGTESQRAQRNFATNFTVLSSDIDQNDVTDANHIVNSSLHIIGGNSLHAVMALDVDSSARLDGFVLTAGLATRHAMYCPEGCGGALYSRDSSPTLANLTVTGNRATYGGGMIFLGESSPTLTDSLFIRNHSEKFAGGLQTQEGAEITVTRVEFFGNTATEVGGGAYINGVDATLNDVTFQENFSDNNGGGIYSVGGTMIINQARFEKNHAANNGGAIYADGGALQIQNARFEKNNSNGGSGPGIYGKNTAIDVKQSDFVGNFAYYNGGAIAALDNDNETTVSLTDVTMSLNQTRNADGGGGALVQEGGRLNALRVNVLRNSGFFYGGGFYLANVNATLGNVQFLGNYVTPPDDGYQSYGGGMAVIGGELTASNIVLSGNYGSTVGAIYAKDTTVQLYHATFTDNSFNPIVSGPESTQGVFVLGSNLFLRNSIMWGSPSVTMIRAADGGTVTIRYSLFENTDEPADSNGNITTQTSPFRTNPSPGDDGFGNDPSTTDDESENDNYGDLRLKPSARAIDAGSNADLPTDLADVDEDSDVAEELPQDIIGAPREVRFVAATPRVDMGAYEYQNVAPTIVMAGPFTLDEGESIALDATGSTDDGSIGTYAWDCTNNGSTDVNEDSPNAGTCAYPDDGTYTLRLTVSDNLNATRTATTTVTVANVAPVYTPADNQSAVAGSAQSFNLGSFTDPGAEGTWDVTVNWGEGSTEFTTDETGSLPAKNFTYASAGTFNVVVTISDGESEDIDSFQIVVSAPPPGAPVVTAPASQAATVGSEQMFALGSFTDAGSSGPWEVTVNWGDGSANTVFTVTDSGQLPAQPHTFGEAGTYAVLVTVSDGTQNTTITFNVTLDAQEVRSSLLLPFMRKE